jgi:hypothetical protein
VQRKLQLHIDHVTEEAYIFISFTHVGIILEKENVNELATAQMLKWGKNT